MGGVYFQPNTSSGIEISEQEASNITRFESMLHDSKSGPGLEFIGAMRICGPAMHRMQLQKSVTENPIKQGYTSRFVLSIAAVVMIWVTLRSTFESIIVQAIYRGVVKSFQACLFSFMVVNAWGMAGPFGLIFFIVVAYNLNFLKDSLFKPA